MEIFELKPITDILFSAIIRFSRLRSDSDSQVITSKVIVLLTHRDNLKNYIFMLFIDWFVLMLKAFRHKIVKRKIHLHILGLLLC